jgi:hypothetical protein
VETFLGLSYDRACKRFYPRHRPAHLLAPLLPSARRLVLRAPRATWDRGREAAPSARGRASPCCGASSTASSGGDAFRARRRRCRRSG